MAGAPEGWRTESVAERVARQDAQDQAGPDVELLPPVPDGWHWERLGADGAISVLRPDGADDDRDVV